MLVSDPPRPNPKIIAWARIDAGYDVERVAKRLGVAAKKISDWEEGKKNPTVRQLTGLANFLRRPLSLFFQDLPPSISPIAAAHRRLPGVIPGKESPEFRRAIREMLARRAIAVDLFEELEYDIPEFRLQAHAKESPQDVGARLRGLIGISGDQQDSWRDYWQAWREWRAALEEAGILVQMFPDVPLDEARGVALPRCPLPIAAVNTKESPHSRAFTALHEVVHLMLLNGAEEGTALEDTHTQEDFSELERFAESVASCALVPEDSLAAALKRNVPMDLEGVRSLAARFKISPLATATRLRESNYWSWDQYNSWRAAWQSQTDQMPRSSGFASPEAKTLGRGGRLYSQLVLEALDSHRITMADAARWLNLRTSSFDRLRERLIKGTAVEAPDE